MKLAGSDESWRSGPVAVLVSGGPDSAVLVGELARSSPRVVPIYVRFGMFWEDDEERALRRYLDQLAAGAVQGWKVFRMPLGDVYGRHWSTTGEEVPDSDSPDAAVFLPGRNLLLLAQAAVWCHLQGVPTLALGLLKGNPFPDSTGAFFASYEAAINQALAGKPEGIHLMIGRRPYAAFGNSTGDRQMLEYTKAGDRARLLGGGEKGRDGGGGGQLPAQLRVPG